MLNVEWYEFFYDLAEYGNKNWKGAFSPKEIATNAYIYLVDFAESIAQGKFTDIIRSLYECLRDDWKNGSDEAKEFALALNNALQMKGDNHESER